MTVECGGEVVINAGEPACPLTQGFWKRQCKGSHPSGEDQNLPSYVAISPGRPVVGPQLWSNAFLPGEHQATAIDTNNATLNGDNHPILGRSITVNEVFDNLKSDPHGGLGKIVACGVIGVAPEVAKAPMVWYTEISKPRDEIVPESLLWYVPEGGYPKEEATE